MNAIKVALFFDLMNRSMIPYTFDELVDNSFRQHFGAKGFGDYLDRKGYFLAVYVTSNSVAEDDFFDGVKFYLDNPVVYKYDSPYQDKEVPEKELMYILEIEG